MPHYTTSEFLSKGLQDLNLSMGSTSQQKLLDFLHFLLKWNQHYNLTAITSLPKMISYHLLDSLATAPFIVGDRILDLGPAPAFPEFHYQFIFHKNTGRFWTAMEKRPVS